MTTTPKDTIWFWIIAFFILVWTVLGLMAFVWAVACVGTRNSDFSSNVIGILLSIVLGPFYWLYYVFAKSYCK